MVTLVALLASAALAFQMSYVVQAFAWAAVHGALGLAGLALLTLPFAVLWSGWALMRRRRSVRGVVGMLVISAALIIGCELVLPMTPLEARRAQAAVNATLVDAVSDEPLLSAAGRPIGIRLSYRVRFPEAGPYHVTPSMAMPNRQPTSTLLAAFTLGLHQLPDSRPAPEVSDGERHYVGGEPYAFTIDLLPEFLRLERGADRPCLFVQPNVNYSDAEYLDAVSRGLPTSYRIELHVDGRPGASRRVAAEYVTAAEYDVGEFYRSAMAEGWARCGAP